MNTYASRTPEALKEELTQVQAHYDELKAMGLKLNMARGKPGKAQLDLVSDILTILSDPEECVSDGIDVRNYGELSGIPAVRYSLCQASVCRSAGLQA